MKKTKRDLIKSLRRYIRSPKIRMGFLILIVILFGLYEIWSLGYNSHEYVTGEFSKYCYEIDNVPGTIKNPIYFGSKKKCEAFVDSHKTRRKFREDNTKTEDGMIYLTE